MRPRFRGADRRFWLLACRWFSHSHDNLIIVKPDRVRPTALSATGARRGALGFVPSRGGQLGDAGHGTSPSRAESAAMSRCGRPRAPTGATGSPLRFVPWKWDRTAASRRTNTFLRRRPGATGHLKAGARFAREFGIDDDGKLFRDRTVADDKLFVMWHLARHKIRARLFGYRLHRRRRPSRTPAA